MVQTHIHNYENTIINQKIMDSLCDSTEQKRRRDDCNLGNPNDAECALEQTKADGSAPNLMPRKRSSQITTSTEACTEAFMPPTVVRRRLQTRLKPCQVAVLETSFTEGASWSKQKIQELADRLQLTNKRVYKWNWERKKKELRGKGTE